MVNNSFLILDAGKIKSTPLVNMPTPDYVTDFTNKLSAAIPVMNAIVHDRHDWVENMFPSQIQAYEWFRDHTESELARHYLHNEKMITTKDYKAIAKLMGVEPFRESVMINISPNWKGDFSGPDIKKKRMIKGFCFVIDSYLNEEFNGTRRFTKYQYCLECGSNGKFLHAHIVAELNPKILKSMITHINKGGHTQQLKKYWEKFFGDPKINQGVWKGIIAGEKSVQRVLIRNEEILKDKLAYLKEENKCEGHRNKVDLQLVYGDFITSKK